MTKDADRQVSHDPRRSLLHLGLAAFLLFCLIVGLAYARSAGLLDVEKISELLRWSPRPNNTVLELFGNVDVRQVNLAFKVEGRIASLTVDEGAAVKSGALLAALDSRYFEDDLQYARSQRDAQEASLSRLENGSRPQEIAEAKALVAEREASSLRAAVFQRRIENLLNRGSASRQEFEDAESAAEVAKAQLKSAREGLRLVEIGPRLEDIEIGRSQLAAQEAEVLRAERRLEDARLISPGDGIILTRAREKGAIVQPGETVFTLTLSSPIWIRTYVSETDLGRIHPGLKVHVVMDSKAKSPYEGTVGFISPTAEFTPKSVETKDLRTSLVYRVRIVVDNPDNSLRQGMPVTVQIPLSREGGGVQ